MSYNTPIRKIYDDRGSQEKSGQLTDENLESPVSKKLEELERAQIRCAECGHVFDSLDVGNMGLVEFPAGERQLLVRIHRILVPLRITNFAALNNQMIINLEFSFDR